MSSSTSSQPALPDLLVSSIQELHANSTGAGVTRRGSPEQEGRLGLSDTSRFLASGTEAISRRTSRRKKRRNAKVVLWNKLLWMKQSYPDNYTDASTFLDHLQRNPRLQPYEFWRLVADSTVIIQHVCSVAIFVCCFTGIFHERVSSITIVGWGSAGTVLGWILWDFWVGNDQDLAKIHNENFSSDDEGLSRASFNTEHGNSNGSLTPRGGLIEDFQDDVHPPPQQWQGDPLSSLSPRNQQRLATIKSAALIYCAVLGLSPILKSLTKSTTSDSIWAMSCWLMGINVFFFDYGGGVSAKFPASLSTNAALMASTVLASRLTSTTHVFSLTIFSIEVFGLFPVFRRHLLHVSRTLHNILTLALVLGAGGSVAITVGGGTWQLALLGCTLGLITAALAMGGASWWLIGLQKWKDEIVGPWDAARPRLRRRWA